MSNAVLSVQPSQTILQELYTNHHHWLLHLLCRRLGCTSTAEDVSQDVFVRLLRKSELPEIQEPRAYLTHIARGLVIDRQRRQVIEQAYLDMISQQPNLSAPSTEDTAIVLETLVQIDAMLSQLKPKVREVFLLSRFGGLTYRCIAKQLDISVATVRNYMRIAICTCLNHC